MNDENKNQELLKLSHSWVKHIGTLSTGSILWMVVFLDKLMQNPQWKFLFVAAAYAFIISIAGTVAVQLERLMQVTYHIELPTLSKISSAAALLGFLTGIISLAIFAVRNL